MADATPRWTFDDFAEGQTIALGSKAVTAQEIVAFASEFDPQPMHLDQAAGKASILGGLSASGWHSCAMFMRLLYDGLLASSTSQGAPGVDLVRWRKPVLAGDTLTAALTVTARRLSKSRPGLGLVSNRSTLTNQRDELVMEFENTIMFLTRAAVS